MKAKKVVVSLRLSEKVIGLLMGLCEREGLAQGVIISLLVQAAAEGWKEEEVDRAFEIARNS